MIRQRVRIRFTKQDDLRWISHRDVMRVWDRLFRGDTSRTERGLGLGLSLVKAVVETHGGTVAVVSGIDINRDVAIEVFTLEPAGDAADPGEP